MREAGNTLNKKSVKPTVRIIKKEQLEVNNNASLNGKNKKPFIEPELRTYPPLKNVTFLSVGAVSGGSVY